MNPVSFNPSALSVQGVSPDFATRRPPQPRVDIEGNNPSIAPQNLINPAGAAPVEFDNVLGRFVTEVNNKQLAAGDAVTGLLSGQNVALHQAMISMEEASVSFQLMLAVRNKLLEGYQELMRLQV
jgi:flagellar hook-basal body complex protein FliE